MMDYKKILRIASLAIITIVIILLLNSPFFRNSGNFYKCTPDFNLIVYETELGSSIKLAPGDVLFDSDGNDVTDIYSYNREKFGVRLYNLPIGEFIILIKYPQGNEPIYKKIIIFEKGTKTPTIYYELFTPLALE